MTVAAGGVGEAKKRGKDERVKERKKKEDGKKGGECLLRQMSRGLMVLNRLSIVQLWLYKVYNDEKVSYSIGTTL